MIHCIIIEDQPPAQRILKKYISEVKVLSLKQTFTDALKASEYLKSEDIDLIFLDIHLPKLSGITFLKSLSNHPKVILTTAFSDYALESYELNVIDYLLKPIAKERFSQAISKVITIERGEKYTDLLKTIVIKSGHELITLQISDIRYIKADSDYTEIITTTKVHLSKEPLKYWVEKLGSTYFCQIHRSYLLHLRYVTKVSGNTVYLDTEVLPLGRAYKKQFITAYLK